MSLTFNQSRPTSHQERPSAAATKPRSSRDIERTGKADGAVRGVQRSLHRRRYCDSPSSSSVGRSGHQGCLGRLSDSRSVRWRAHLEVRHVSVTHRQQIVAQPRCGCGTRERRKLRPLCGEEEAQDRHGVWRSGIHADHDHCSLCRHQQARQRRGLNLVRHPHGTFGVLYDVVDFTSTYCCF